MNEFERNDDNSILGNEQRVSAASSTNSGTDFSNETDSEHSDGTETITVNVVKAQTSLPGGCNVFYGTYIDNYQASVRRRYYLDSYGNLVLTQTSTNVSQPTGVACLTEMPMSHNKDVGIVLASCCAAAAIALAVKFVLGRLIK